MRLSRLVKAPTLAANILRNGGTRELARVISRKIRLRLHLEVPIVTEVLEIEPEVLSLPVEFSKKGDYGKSYESLRDEILAQEAERLARVTVSPCELLSIDLQEFDISLHPSQAPVASLIIPVHNHLKLTLECLASIAVNTTGIEYEVILVDDQSENDVASVLQDVSGIRYLRTPTSLHYLKSCNYALSHAKGTYVCFMNNDVQVQPGWLTELVEVLERNQSAGIAGPKLLFPSGHLQEAGARITRDGFSEMVGLNDDPSRPCYNYERQVPYVSGACLLIRKELALELGGFDEIFSPAYFEDSDLCFRAREKGYQVIFQPKSVVIHHLSATTSQESLENKLRQVKMNQATFVERWIERLDDDHFVKLIAFFLPQFHPIPHNDIWWGKGFTEWSNVVKAKPNHKGHYQPHLPSDLGYYDLRVVETLEQQADLASRYGIFGFCYYYYWFDGNKLLDQPLNKILETGRPDFPFCLCWANENWSRRWDGEENEILMAQAYTDQDSLALIEDVCQYFRLKQYIRIDGKPVFLLYRPSLLPDVFSTTQLWRQYCRENGIGEIFLMMVESMDQSGIRTPAASLGFDMSIEFPPHGMGVPEREEPEEPREEFRGRRFDYRNAALHSLAKERPSAPWHRGVFPSWDNTARRQDHAHIFTHSDPGRYQAWLEMILDQTRRFETDGQQMVFINAWNEWAEGAHLEPDLEWGHGYLEATRNAQNADRIRRPDPWS